MKPFFDVQTLAQVHAQAAEIAALPPETVPLAQACGRTLAKDLRAAADLPGFSRSTMDGYAVRGRDTFGTSESTPGYLRLVGSVRMGQDSELLVRPGECVAIGTGGMLPEGADAVVMIEHTRELADGTVEIVRPVAPGGHVLGPTDDAEAGETMLAAGQRLRAQDVGLLAALGVGQVAVVRAPRLGILSTGDEVVAVEATPRPGQVRDVNAHMLAAQVRDAGGVAVSFGRVGDDEQALERAVREAIAQVDVLLLSGGSSMGARDLTAEVFGRLPGARLRTHGVAVAPGKPFIWAQADAGHLLGLPGHVTSCMIAFHLFVEPLIERMLGRPARSLTRFAPTPAVLSRNLPSVPGREAYIRVRLVQRDGQSVAEPLFGKSALLRTLTQADGLVVVPMQSEGLDEGAAVTVMRFP